LVPEPNRTVVAALSVNEAPSFATGVQTDGAGAGAGVGAALLSTSHSLTWPYAGSDPKNVFVHATVPETVFVIHFVPEPYRAVVDEATLNDPPSAATRDQLVTASADTS